MNELMIPALEMTSKEIAELTGKRHSDVLRDIRVMLNQLLGEDSEANDFLRYVRDQQLMASEEPEEPEELVRAPFRGISVHYDQHTRRTALYSLDKDLTLTLISGYDARLRLVIIKRWQELENRPTLTQDAPKMSSRTIAELSGRLHKIVLKQIRTLLAEMYHWEATGPFRSAHVALRVSPELQRQYQKVGVEMALDEFGFISEVFLDDRHCRALMANYPARTQGRLLVHLRALEDTYHGSCQLLAKGPSQHRLAPPRT